MGTCALCLHYENVMFLGFSSRKPLPERQWAVASKGATHLHTSIFMLATAKTAMGGGFWRNTVSKLKLKNRCTGSTTGLGKMVFQTNEEIDLFAYFAYSAYADNFLFMLLQIQKRKERFLYLVKSVCFGTNF